MNRAIVNVAMGERYVPMAGRLAQSLRGAGDTSKLMQWVNAFPAGAPTSHPLPYAAYCAKPFAMREAQAAGHDLVLWVDSACYAIKPLDDLWKHIDEHGYYVQDNGWNVGQWCADHALPALMLSREEAMLIPEISTMVVGLDLRRQECQKFLALWTYLAGDGRTFIGEHANDHGQAITTGVPTRTVGHVSDDPRVLGHRHDQTAASVLAYRAGWSRTPRGQFVDYFAEHQDERTVLVNRGM